MSLLNKNCKESNGKLKIKSLKPHGFPYDNKGIVDNNTDVREIVGKTWKCTCGIDRIAILNHANYCPECNSVLLLIDFKRNILTNESELVEDFLQR